MKSDQTHNDMPYDQTRLGGLSVTTLMKDDFLIEKVGREELASTNTNIASHTLQKLSFLDNKAFDVNVNSADTVEKKRICSFNCKIISCGSNLLLSRLEQNSHRSLERQIHFLKQESKEKSLCLGFGDQSDSFAVAKEKVLQNQKNACKSYRTLSQLLNHSHFEELMKNETFKKFVLKHRLLFLHPKREEIMTKYQLTHESAKIVEREVNNALQHDDNYCDLSDGSDGPQAQINQFFYNLLNTNNTQSYRVNANIRGRGGYISSGDNDSGNENSFSNHEQDEHNEAHGNDENDVYDDLNQEVEEDEMEMDGGENNQD